MSNDRGWVLVNGLFGGLLAGLSLSQGLTVLMPIGIALLWEISENTFACGVWGFIALLVSHQWLLALHPLTWMGVPEVMSLPIAISIWILCGLIAAALVSFWSLIGSTLFFSSFRNGTLREKILFAILMSSLWGLVEVLLAKGPLFWIGISGSLFPGDIPLAGLGRWIGSGGLSAVLLMIGFWLWQIINSFRRKILQQNLFYWGIVLIIALHFAGGILLLQSDFDNTKRVAVWQTNIPTRRKFSKLEQDKLPLSIERSLQTADKLSASWLIAPEGTLGTNTRLLSSAPVSFLSGGFRSEKGRIMSSLLFYQEGDKYFSSSIDKHRLVPLGEWIPGYLATYIRDLSAVGGLTHGLSSRLFEWEGPPAAIAICYEISNGNAMALAASDGAQWLLAISNLDPYPISLQKQFLALSQLRSIETSKELLSVSNTGPTALISPSGETRYIISPFEEGLNTVELHFNSRNTFYTRWRETPLVIALSTALLMSTYARYKTYR